MKDAPAVPGPSLCTSTELVPVCQCFFSYWETRTESSTSGMAPPVLRRQFSSINLLATIVLMQPRKLLANSLKQPLKTSVSINQVVKAKSLTHFQKSQQLDYNQKEICRVTCWWAVFLRLAKVIQITYSKILSVTKGCEVNRVQKIHMHLRLLLITVISLIFSVVNKWYLHGKYISPEIQISREGISLLKRLKYVIP